MPILLRRGDSGEAVRDLQQRLAALGRETTPDEAGALGDATDAAVRAFQEARGLRVDGVVGPETWATLVESGFTLSDRLLYFRRPMLSGDDVLDLQQRLNRLGFDAGREDGILGSATAAAVVEFQRNAGLAVDGICGSTTVAELRRLGSLAEGEVASVREREALRSGPRHLSGRKVLVATPPGLAVLGDSVTKQLLDLGADAMLEPSEEDDHVVAAVANAFAAYLVLVLRPGDAHGMRFAHFASGRFRAELGFRVATAVRDELAELLSLDGEVCGKAYAILRETTMASVVCELYEDGDVEGMRLLVAHAGDVANAIVRGVRRAVEDPAAEH